MTFVLTAAIGRVPIVEWPYQGGDRVRGRRLDKGRQILAFRWLDVGVATMVMQMIPAISTAMT